VSRRETDAGASSGYDSNFTFKFVHELEMPPPKRRRGLLRAGAIILEE
jgi:hypothetical protein